MYKEFGCCDYQKDQDLMTKYYRIMDNFDYHGYSNCAGFVLELLCQVGMHGQRSLGLVQNISIMRQDPNQIYKDEDESDLSCDHVEKKL